MSKFFVHSLAAFALCAIMTTGSAWAQGRGHGRPANSAQAWRGDRDGDIGRDWRGDRDRWTFGNSQRPPGWDKGRKTGWGDCDVPPGQAKKMGCNSGWPISRVRRHDRDRDRDRLRWRDRDRDRNRDRRRR